MIDWSFGTWTPTWSTAKITPPSPPPRRAMAAIHIPLLLQWFPDPVPYPGPSSKCIGKAGAVGYVQAYRGIVRRFRLAGADNVALVWSVDTNDSPAGTWKGYYPRGSSFVDWIAADGYDRSPTPPTVGLVENRFRAWYAAFSSSGKPLMISDTGAMTGQEPSVQPTYLNLLGSVLPTAFPLIKAVVYRDGPAAGPADPYDYTLDQAGQSAFDSLSAGPYFQPVRFATTTSVSASDASPPLGKVVTITAAVAGSDRGGSVSFVDNGSPISGCGDVQVINASSCETSSLPEGANDITADYLGDAAYAPSESASVAVTVGSTPAEQGRPYIPPVGTAYLGAWVRPLPVTKLTPVNQELSALPCSTADWAARCRSSTSTRTGRPRRRRRRWRGVLANGATPMIDWRCGPSDATILSGRDDALITSFARELAQLKAPVFLRWFYEINFPNSPDYKACIGKLGAGGLRRRLPAHPRPLHGRRGQQRVVRVVHRIGRSGPGLDQVLPGAGLRRLDRCRRVPPELRRPTRPASSPSCSAPGYSTFDSFGKPMMIAETAALAGAHGPYLSDVQQSLDNGYPMIRGVLYFDAPGKGGTYHYPLDSSGYSAFRSLANDRHFQPPQESSTTSVTVSTSSAAPAEAVRISADVVTDYGGSVSLFRRVPRHRLPADACGHRPGLHDDQPPRRQGRAHGRLQR